MSDTDSFIEEVSEEVRRDRLFKLMKKYGWIAIALVLLLVGGAAFNEYRKARDNAAAQAFGDSMMQALQISDPAERSEALNGLSTEGDKSAVLGLIAAAQEVATDDPQAAISSLQQVARDAALPEIYRHLAELKLILLQGDSIPAAERLSRLEQLTYPGAPFRLLAEEQMALVEISSGDTDLALDRLTAILADGEVTAGLRRRATQLIVALGGDLEPA